MPVSPGAETWRGVFTLSPEDRFLHLSTHLLRHAYGVPGPPSRATLAELLSGEAPVLRAKWVLDLVAELERMSVIGSPSPRTLAAVAEEWNAAAELAWVATLLADLDPLPEASGFLEELRGRLPEPARTSGGATRGEEPLEGLDFRPGALASLRRWAFPPADFLSRRYGRAGGRVRVRHATAVAVRLVEAACLLPVALAGRRLAAGRRRRALLHEHEPERVLDLAVAWRALSRD